MDPSLANGTTFRVKASNRDGVSAYMQLKYVFICSQTGIIPFDQVDHILTNITSDREILKFDFSTFFKSADSTKCPIIAYSLVKSSDDTPLDQAM